ncbi:OLC1v1038165C1 [Oldenlandia corymbosa var. corymbosa]|uniref:OLC1v1038165C1 n=1 Tax=Oldenlandia corymbosa var. corymbosa TaxID=529605 RepID=A0AAV1D0E4_OLDCO|nr:OLC1v1038165C1 [Oldenlandia corymbosa var. corymbosa]
MKDKNGAKPATSILRRIWLNCAAQAKEYGRCVAAKVPVVERDMCLKEFLILQDCMQNVLEEMSGKASSSQSSGFNGSGALSHVYIQHPPLRFKIPGCTNLFYDDGSKLLLAPTASQIFSWKTAPFDPQAAPSSDPVAGGPILSARYSLDSKLLAIQRSSQEVQIWNREGGSNISYKCRSESEHILGYFWTDCPTCDIVFVKTSGLDFLSYNSESKSLTVVETKKTNVSWYIYTHESRLVLLASGMQCKSLTGYQISSAGIVRLPRFEMAMAKSEANSKPVLAAEDVHIVTVYGRIYCLQLDRVAMLLHLYRFYRDAVIQQGSLPVYSNRVAVSAVDNVLLVHQVDAKVVIMYDLFSDSRAPVSAPLPLLLRGFPRAGALSSSQSTSWSTGTSDTVTDNEAVAYGDGWLFLVPDLVCDATNGLLWKINLDLEAISASTSEVPFVIDFLQRRRSEASKAKQLCLALARTMILERRPVSTVARALDVLVTAYSQSVRTGSYQKKTKAQKTMNSGGSDVNSSSTPIEDASNRAEAIGKSVENIPERSSFSTSDSDDNVNTETQKINSIRSDSSTGSKIEGEHSTRTRASFTGVYQNSAESQIPRPSDAPLNASASENQESQVTSAVTSLEDLYNFVFAPVEEEMAGDSCYLVAVIVELLRRANLEKLKVCPSIYILIVRVLARSERHAELGLYIINKIIEPSKEVAYQLIESGRLHSQTRKLGLDMLRQLALHHDYVLLLLQDGYYLEALRYARKNKVNTVRPASFLEAAYASNNSQQLAAVLRFFSDSIPGFKTTSEHSTYSQVLAEMSALMVT